MGWREYKHLYAKYEGNIALATDREIEHANRGDIDPAIARRIAEAGYKRRERIMNDEQLQKKNPKAVGSDKRFSESLFK